MFHDFFGFAGYQREAEGFLSWQHLAYVSAMAVVMIAAAVLLGRRDRHAPAAQKNRVLAAAAILLDGAELLRILLLCIFTANPLLWLGELPLFLCSIQLITVPLAAFAKGRLKEAALDFVCLFGLLGAFFGTYCAGNIYSYYPVVSFHTFASGFTHMLSGFASLYIMITGMASLKKENRRCAYGILLAFCLAAYIANLFTGANYMFLMAGDGTPYDILYRLLGGNPILYPLSVAALFLLYIRVLYALHHRLIRRRAR